MYRALCARCLIEQWMPAAAGMTVYIGYFIVKTAFYIRKTRLKHIFPKE